MDLLDKRTQLVDMPMLSNFVHQIINPLNGVIGTLDNIIDGTTSPTKQMTRLVEIRAQLEHAIDLIRNLAYLSELSMNSGAAALREKRQPCVIPQIVIEAALYFQEAGKKRGVCIELADPKTQYTVQGFPALLRQVFMNIFENGVKYADEGTTITVNPRPQKKTGMLFVEIESYGPGFESSERERIFELGFRGQRAAAVTASGSGLGLFIARRIVELHGGTIEAEHAESARRTVFRVRLPEFSIGDRFYGIR